MIGLRACLIILLIGVSPAISKAACADGRPDDKRAVFPQPKDAAQRDQATFLHFSIITNKNRNTIYVWGEICLGDAERVRTTLNSYQPITEVILASPGGSLEDGLSIGRIIRQNKITTRIRSGEYCLSACNFMFMGGIIRYIEPGGQFGVHMFASNGLTEKDKIQIEVIEGLESKVKDYNDKNPTNKVSEDDLIEKQMSLYVQSIQQDAAQTASEIARFIVEMQLSLRFLTEFASIPNESPKILSRDELRDFNIVNAE